jgi:hypothetical protein
MSKKLEEQIKPILEKLTFGVLKNKPDNIVSNINIYFFLAKIHGSILTRTRRLWSG